MKETKVASNESLNIPPPQAKDFGGNGAQNPFPGNNDSFSSNHSTDINNNNTNNSNSNSNFNTHFNSNSNSTYDTFIKNHSSTPSRSSRRTSISTTNNNELRKKKSSFSLLRKPSFNHDTSLVPNTDEINPTKITDLPDELLPIVTLINHQQSRSYFKGYAYYNDSSLNSNINNINNDNNDNNNSSWIPVYMELNGNDISVSFSNEQNIDNPNTVINICDCELNYNKDELILTVSITNESIMYFKFNTIEELNLFYSSVLLCKFEYQQLQESYTGALLSAQAIKFSDIKTLLSPSNKHVKEEWSVIRFPFLNDKWIRCLLVIKPNNKIQVYISSNKSSKNLLAVLNNGLSCYTIYPNNPNQIQNNSLLRLSCICYINNELLKIILNDETISSTNENIPNSLSRNSTSNSRRRSKSIRSNRSNSLSKRLSISSLRSSPSIEETNSSFNSNPNSNSNSNTNSNTNSNSNSNFERLNKENHQRVRSVDSTLSERSNSKKFNKNKDIIKSNLVYIIPESHASVKPCEIMLRLIIPIFNSFKLYGRPNKFISSRTDTNSLLFGLPQLPNTYYLNNKSSLDLININIDNSIKEEWDCNDWNSIFKELMLALMNKGWKGGSYEGDLTNLNICLTTDHHGHGHGNNIEEGRAGEGEDEFLYDPLEDFVDASSNVRSSVMTGY